MFLSSCIFYKLVDLKAKNCLKFIFIVLKFKYSDHYCYKGLKGRTLKILLSSILPSWFVDTETSQRGCDLSRFPHQVEITVEGAFESKNNFF